jgi:D-glycero-alpha-D-manno-heptose-7-phosphate kinase
MLRRITATTPTRIDLAGGTVDLYPLSAFLGGTTTVNLAIDLECRAVVTEREDGRYRFRSEDGGAVLEIESADALRGWLGGSPLDLLVEAVAFWRPSCGLDVTTRNAAPRGSGLGASSALLIALLGALRALESKGGDYDFMMCQWAAAIEAKHIQVPTGYQDYHAAMYGGPLAIDYSLWGAKPEKLEPAAGFLEWFERSVQLFFTGEPHFSGAPNWAVLRAYVEKDATTQECLRTIARIALAMREAVRAGDRDRFTALLADEWEARKRLADGVTTPGLERIIAAALGAGARAAKACGAGGGGCLVVVAPEERALAVAAAAEAVGARRLDYRVRRAGLTLAEERIAHAS